MLLTSISFGDVASNVIASFAILAVTSLMAWGGWSIKKWVQQVVVDMNKRIDDRTKPIQRDANGGLSLPDANRALVSIEGKIDSLHGRITDLARDVSHLTGRFDEHIRDN